MSDHEEKAPPQSGDITTQERNNTIKPGAKKKNGELSTEERNNTIRPAT
ncbi:hypothetical protein [Streptomyces spirodelae]|uniref:Uncharacterized protein n=1 Tax=Streptomyces spirodelae TaxID=2812904 RepID=A0ABS3WUL2_9ACTN|nr:hypothetical protein [Streptomyces spirodelae]MBO8186546.1 hypothetical protein [Streptomyces spirodelae]